MQSGDNELFETTKRQEDKFPSRDSRVWQDSLEKVRSITTNYTVDSDDDYILIDTTAGIITLTLPNAISRRKLIVIKTAGGNNITISPVGTDTINGASSLTITTSYSPVRLKAITGGYITI